MIKRIVILLFFFSITGYSQIPDYNWGGQIGGTDSDSASKLTTDIFGNVFVAGRFDGTANFDLDGSNTNNLTITDDRETFIAKYSPNGDLIWVKNFLGDAFISSLESDSSGNLYIMGYFTEAIDLNPNSATNASYTTLGSFDIFIAKLDVNGTFVWGGRIGSSDFERAYDMTLDNQDNIYLTGSISGMIDFDISDNEFLVGRSTSSQFIVKLDKNANVLWGKADASGSGRAIAVDDEYNIYVAGTYRGSADLDPGPDVFTIINNRTVTSLFVSKLDNTGSFISGGGALAENIDSISLPVSIALDSNNNVYVAGYFARTVDFDIGSGEQYINSSGFWDVFVLKLGSNLNYSWAGKMGGFVGDQATAMVVGKNDIMYTTGIYTGGIGSNFDPNGSYWLSGSNSSDDVFISALGSDRSFIDIANITGSRDNRASDIAVDKAGNIFIAGFFVSSFKALPSIDWESYTGGIADGYIIKYGNTPNNPPSNFPPVATNDQYGISSGETKILTVSSNDSDSDGTLVNSSIIIITEPAHGSITNNGDGTITYTHDGSSNLDDQFEYSIEDNDGATSNVAEVSLSSVLSTSDETFANQTDIFPNPTSSYIQLKSQVEIAKIEVYNLLGVKIKTVHSSNQVDLSDLSSGTYILLAESKTGARLRKTIIRE